MNVSDVEIRECTNAALLRHAEVLTREYVDSWYEEGEAYRSADAQLLAEFTRRFDGRSGVAWVALEREAPVGSVLMSPIGGDSVELMKLFVRPAKRGYGVGASLVAAVLAWASPRNQVVRLIVEQTRKPAQALYVRLGFQQDLAYPCPDGFLAFVWMPTLRREVPPHTDNPPQPKPAFQPPL